MPLHIVRNDIVNMECDAIVNTANPYPTIGAGTDFAIYAAAGEKKLLAARRKIGNIAPGEAAVTSGYRLKARYIIHTVGPVWEGGRTGEERILRSCYRNALRLAEVKRCRSIAFPLISSGSYGYPKNEALTIAVGEIREFLLHSNITVYLVVFGKEAYELSGRFTDAVEVFIDEHYVRKQNEIEYGVQTAGNLTGEARLRRDRRHYDNAAGPVVFSDEAESEAASFFPEYKSDACKFRESEHQPMPVSGVPTERPRPAAQMPLFHHKKKKKLEDSDLILAETFSETVLRHIDERKMTDVEVYKRANIDRKLFSKIRSRRDYQPKKKTALALAVALRLDLDQTKDLLARAGYAISPSSKFDLIVEFFIDNEIYDIDTINIALFEHQEDTLG